MKATDEMLWEALDIAQLKPVVKSLPGGLGEETPCLPLQYCYTIKRETASFCFCVKWSGLPYHIPSAALLRPCKHLSVVSGHTSRGFFPLTSHSGLRVPWICSFLRTIFGSHQLHSGLGTPEKPSAVQLPPAEPQAICSLSHSQK